MRVEEINQLLRFGAKDRVRKKLKRLAIPERMVSLNDCIPIVKQSPANLKFFKENFSVELGAIMLAEGDLDQAVKLYNSAKKIK
jgi:hypothetical protein